MNRERLAKINELIKRELGQVIERELERTRSEFVTITEAITSDDLLHTKVKVSIWPDKSESDLFERLVKSAGFYQMLLNKRLRMRPVPHISFELDARVRDAGRVEELLEKTHND